MLMTRHIWVYLGDLNSVSRCSGTVCVALPVTNVLLVAFIVTALGCYLNVTLLQTFVVKY